MGTDLFSNLALVATNFVVAVLIGATAIGGLLLAPGLNVVGDVPIHNVFRAYIIAHPEVCERMLRMLAGQVRHLATRVEEFSFLNVRQRVFAELLRLGRPRGSDNQAVISPPPYHAEIAARVSTHREAATRALRHLEQIGLLQRRQGALILPNVSALQGLIQAA